MRQAWFVGSGDRPTFIDKHPIWMFPCLLLDHQYRFGIQWHLDGFSSLRLVGVHPCTSAFQLDLVRSPSTPLSISFRYRPYRWGCTQHRWLNRLGNPETVHAAYLCDSVAGCCDSPPRSATRRLPTIFTRSPGENSWFGDRITVSLPSSRLT